jgi:hypothetical protein
VRRHFLRVLERAALDGCAVIPLARKAWQPIASAMPAATERRRIMRQASGWAIGFFGTHFAVVTSRRAEQPALAILGDARGVD